MSDTLRQAAQQALEALDQLTDAVDGTGFSSKPSFTFALATIDALRAALAEPVQEPVAWQWLNTGHFRKKLPRTAELGNWQPLYTTPPQRKPLTDEQIEELNLHYLMTQSAKFTIVRAIERAHGIGKQE